MFQSTRLKLTTWYLLIIIFISGIFSVAIYTLINQEYNRFEEIQERRQERERDRPDLNIFPLPSLPDPEVISEARVRLQMFLFLINLGILSVAGVAGYFLAGRTLRPIKQMVDEQNRFITDASHELRTPITSLKSEIEVNLRDKKISGDTKKILESNLEEVNRLQTLSDGLIGLTQYQKSNGNIIFQELSLSEIIEEAQKRVTNLAKPKKISILNQIKDYNLPGNKQSLVELFVILLDNAIKYSDENTKITLLSREIDHSIIVEIKDQGLGISQEDIPHLFNRFFRADKSRTKTHSSGYGLGLSIAKQIVGQHKGSIKVTSEIGLGSIFSVQLPA